MHSGTYSLGRTGYPDDLPLAELCETLINVLALIGGLVRAMGLCCFGTDMLGSVLAVLA